jgi:hypothetical protein
MSQEGQVTVTQAEATLMADPLWRIRNIYTIRDKQGRVIPFRPNVVQEAILHAIFVLGQRRIVVLKSRKHGVSTLFEVIGFDFCYFGEHLQMSIIDLTHPNASDKLTKICRFLWESLDGEIKEKLISDSTTMIEFANGSNINAGKAARGGQNQILHISEWGPIAHEDPERSEEIKTGALPSADEGMVWVESTFKGGKGGDFYELIVRAQQTPPDQMTAKDFHFMFFPWWQDERNTLAGDPSWIPAKMRAYLDKLEVKIARKLTGGQRVWYWKTALEQGIFMQREYPSTVEEAFNAPVEGAVFGEIMSEIRAEGHIVPFPRERGAPVFAVWDIGYDDSTSVWLFQLVGRSCLWLLHKTVRHMNAGQVYLEIQKAEIPIDTCILPHDGKSHAAGTGTSYRDELEKAGASNIIVAPRPVGIGPGINLLRDLLARSWFNEPGCSYGISALESYHTKEVQVGGVTSRDPVHDWSSHPTDAARVAAEAIEQGLLSRTLSRPISASVPRGPDGEVFADLDHIRQSNRSMFRRSGLAKSAVRHQ